MITQVLENEVGRGVISIILGLGLAALFRRVCKGNNCIIVRGPPISKIKDKIFIFDNSCYKYEPKITNCNNQTNGNNNSS
tara:strand:+ start:508 stop:747 length:240 start_codon:yes stop_codon:yes gene_type:complete